MTRHHPGMVTLTVTDPAYRARILAVHADLTPTDVRELSAIYRALGYPPASIRTVPAEVRAA